MIHQLRAGRDGADRRALPVIQAQYAEFAGWLHQDTRDFPAAILAALRSPRLGQPPDLTAACAASARSLTALITALNEQVKTLQGAGGGAFWPAPGC